METAAACLAPRIKPMLPWREATTIACHCFDLRFTPSANNKAKKKGNLQLEKGKTAQKRALHHCGDKHFRKCE
jgi:hypothetical protein